MLMLALLQYGPFAPQALPCFIAPMNHSDDSAQPVPWLWFPMARCPSSDRWKSDTGEPSRIFRFLLRHALSSTTPPSSLDASDHCFSKDVRLRHLRKVGHWDLCNEAESSSLSLGLASSLSRGLKPLVLVQRKWGFWGRSLEGFWRRSGCSFCRWRGIGKF